MQKTLITLIFAALLLAAGCSPAASTAASAVTPPGVTPTAAQQPASAYPAGSSADTTQPTAVLTAQSTNAASAAYPAGSGAQVFSIDPQKSSAQYRVREQLAKHDLPSDAVGKTSDISGSITVNPDGTIDSANSKFTVNLTSLQTDSSMRDGYVSRNILQTSQYPDAVFVPKEVKGLPWPLPQSGVLSFQVSGDLTLHGVTKPVTWDVSGTITNGEAIGTAKTSFTFEDFNLNQPRVPVVLSVVDNITLEVNIALKGVNP